MILYSKACGVFIIIGTAYTRDRFGWAFSIKDHLPSDAKIDDLCPSVL